MLGKRSVRFGVWMSASATPPGITAPSTPRKSRVTLRGGYRARSLFRDSAVPRLLCPGRRRKCSNRFRTSFGIRSSLTKMTNHRCTTLAILALLLGRFTSGAAVDLVSITYSPDITVVLGSRVVVDGEVVRERSDGFTQRLIAGGPSDVDAFHRFADGSVLLSLEASTVANGRFASPADILAFGSGGVQTVLDSRSLGVPVGANADAVSIEPVTDALLISFDITVKLGDTVFADEDVIRFNGQSFSMYFDASAAGIAEGLDLDGVHAEHGLLLVSFDGSGRAGGVHFDDEDVLEYDEQAGSWSLAYDGSARFDGWKPGDLDALFAVVEQDEPPPPVQPEGDLDGDFDVDQADFQILSRSLGLCAGDQGFAPAADYDQDGCVTSADSDRWFDHFVTFLIQQILSNGVLQ